MSVELNTDYIYPFYYPKVSLNSFSSPFREDSQNLVELIAYCARVSNPDNQWNDETAPKLLSYLLKHKHWSPFEMVNVVLEINTTRDIARQILRHRSFSFQEFSQRYAEGEGFCIKPLRLQDKKNRQSSIQVKDNRLKNKFHRQQEVLIAEAVFQYRQWLKEGVAKEQARCILPEGNTLTRLYMNGNMRSWIHYIQERTKMGTQEEHRWVAFMCAAQLETVFPIIYEFADKEGYANLKERAGYTKQLKKANV